MFCGIFVANTIFEVVTGLVFHSIYQRTNNPNTQVKPKVETLLSFESKNLTPTFQMYILDPSPRGIFQSRDRIWKPQTVIPHSPVFFYPSNGSQKLMRQSSHTLRRYVRGTGRYLTANPLTLLGLSYRLCYGL